MKSIAVLGLGKYGSAVADALMEGGAEVMVVDYNEDLVDRYSDRVTHALIADLSDAKAVAGLGIGNMDAVVVCMAMDLEASIISIMVAKEQGVPLVIAKARSRRMGEILKKIGADQIVYPEEESGNRTARKLITSDFLEFFDLSDDLCIIEMVPKEQWVGQSLKALNLRGKFGINVVAIRNGERVNAVINPDRPLEKSDSLLMVVNKEDVKKFR
ncbi:MAG: TrkA family potassium uptake protein [Lachnospiraceae bacterium]|nr:TrkA family potassium uptake protein [Lachnospiraceae bacterium]